MNARAHTEPEPRQPTRRGARPADAVSAAEVVTLRALAPLREDDFATSCGGFMSLQRLEELERDTRYRASYVVAHQGERTMAILPLYAPLTAQISDPAYDPARLAAAGGAVEDPTAWLLVGGRADLSCGVVARVGCDPNTRAAAVRTIGIVAREIARSERRRMVAFYARERDAAIWTLLMGAYDAETLDHHAELSVASDGEAGLAAALTSSHRSILRRDWRARTELGLETTVVPWEDVLDDAVPLVAAVKEAHAEPDHPRLIRMRLEQWLTHDTVAPVAFRVDRGREGPLAVSFGWRWRDWLQLYEIGLVDRGLPARHIAYVEAMVYAPLRFAAASGCETLTLGLGSTEPKRLRGATLEPVFALVQRE